MRSCPHRLNTLTPDGSTLERERSGFMRLYRTLIDLENQCNSTFSDAPGTRDPKTSNCIYYHPWPPVCEGGTRRIRLDSSLFLCLLFRSDFEFFFFARSCPRFYHHQYTYIRLQEIHLGLNDFLSCEVSITAVVNLIDRSTESRAPNRCLPFDGTVIEWSLAQICDIGSPCRQFNRFQASNFSTPCICILKQYLCHTIMFSPSAVLWQAVRLSAKKRAT